MSDVAHGPLVIRVIFISMMVFLFYSMLFLKSFNCIRVPDNIHFNDGVLIC